MTPPEMPDSKQAQKASLAAPSCSAARMIERGRIVGHETTLHVFQSRKRCEAAKALLSSVGVITEIFVNNHHAFECKLWRTGPVEAAYAILDSAPEVV